MTEIIKKAKTGSVKLGKVKVGLPGSDSYNAKTPKRIKQISETLTFIGGTIGILGGAITLNPLVTAIGGICVLGGRFLLKCFSESK